MATLKTNYKDDMFSGSRKYQETRNQDGTVSFTDMTQYTQQGDVFGSADINATNTEVNGINASLTDNGASFRFGCDPISGSYGYYDSENNFKSFGGGGMPALDYTNPLYTFDNSHKSYTATNDCYYVGTLGGAEDISINNNVVYSQSSVGTAYLASTVMGKLSAGDTISMSSVSKTVLHVYAEA